MSDSEHDDILEWLKQQRDHHAAQRDWFFQTDDWSKGNPHDEMARRLYTVIVEIERNRRIIGCMKDVLMNRIIEGYRT